MFTLVYVVDNKYTDSFYMGSMKFDTYESAEQAHDWFEQNVYGYTGTIIGQ